MVGTCRWDKYRLPAVIHVPCDGATLLTTSTAVLLLLRSGGQRCLVEVEQVRVDLELDLRNDIPDDLLVLFGTGAHDLDEVAGLRNGLDSILQGLVVDAVQIDLFAADLADPYGVAVLVLVAQSGAGGGVTVGAQGFRTEPLVLYALFVLNQCVVEFRDCGVVATKLGVGQIRSVVFDFRHLGTSFTLYFMRRLPGLAAV